MRKPKINARIEDISYLYWVLFVFYIGFGFFGMSWFGNYYFDAHWKPDVSIFCLSIVILLLGGLEGVWAIFGSRLMRLGIFSINVVFFIVMVGVFRISEFSAVYFLLLLVLAMKCRAC